MYIQCHFLPHLGEGMFDNFSLQTKVIFIMVNPLNRFIIIISALTKITFIIFTACVQTTIKYVGSVCLCVSLTVCLSVIVVAVVVALYLSPL